MSAEDETTVMIMDSDYLGGIAHMVEADDSDQWISPVATEQAMFTISKISNLGYEGVPSIVTRRASGWTNSAVTNGLALGAIAPSGL